MPGIILLPEEDANSAAWSCNFLHVISGESIHSFIFKYQSGNQSTTQLLSW